MTMAGLTKHWDKHHQVQREGVFEDRSVICSICGCDFGCDDTSIEMHKEHVINIHNIEETDADNKSLIQVFCYIKNKCIF